MSRQRSPLTSPRWLFGRLPLALGAVAVAAALWATACGDNDPTNPGENPTVAITLDRNTVTLKTGTQTTLVATAVDKNGSPTGDAVSWATSDAEIAGVTGTGIVTAVSFGTTTVTATAGSINASATVVVQPRGTVIGPAGGVVISEDGNASLTVAPGALAKAVDVELLRAGDEMFGADPDFIAGTGYEVRASLQLQEHAHLAIRAPATLPPGVTPERLRIEERDRIDNHWHDLVQMGLDQQFVVADLNVVGFYGLVAGSTTVLIGPAGGTVRSADGNAELVVPAGALTVPTEITIVPAADALFGSDTDFLSGSGYEVAPATLQLHVRAQLRIRLDPARLPSGVTREQVRLRERDRLQQRWNDCEHAGIQNQFVAANIDRAGLYALMIRPIIGPTGGLVQSADGNAVLTIPAGALTTDITVELVPAEDAVLLGDPLYVAGTAYEIRPAGTQPGQPMELRINFETGNVPAGADPDRLRIRSRDRVQQQWRDCQHVGIQGRTITASVTAFGTFGIVAAEPQGGPVTRVTVTPATLSLDEGDVVQLTAVATDAQDRVVEVPITWATDNMAIATVDQTGLVTGVAEGTVTISASAQGVKGNAGVSVKRKVRPASITVTPTMPSIVVGSTLQLTAVVRDIDGNTLPTSVSWTSSATSVATVSSTGMVTGVMAGSATISASAQGVSGSTSLTVNPPASSIVISGNSNSPLEVGATRQLVATAYNNSGQPVNVNVQWTSSDDGIATVDQTGLVTGVAKGTATIAASVGSVSASVSVKVVGGETTTLGNNMSWPTVFADGVGVTGLAVATDPGVRPGPTEGITVDVLPFFYSGNVADYGTYYLQQGVNTWRAALIDGTGQAAYDAEAYWGDNLTAKEWSTTRPIRIEVALSATGVGTLAGYNMTLLYGEGTTEMQGTDGTTAAYVPLIYTIGTTLTVDRLSAEGGQPVAQVQSGPIAAEVNVAGRIVYGAQLKLDTWTPPAGMTLDGWYRLTFAVNSSMVRIRTVGNTTGMFLPVVVNTQETSLDIHIVP